MKTWIPLCSCVFLVEKAGGSRFPLWLSRSRQVADRRHGDGTRFSPVLEPVLTTEGTEITGLSPLQSLQGTRRDSGAHRGYRGNPKTSEEPPLSVSVVIASPRRSPWALWLTGAFVSWGLCGRCVLGAKQSLGEFWNSFQEFLVLGLSQCAR